MPIAHNGVMTAAETPFVKASARSPEGYFAWEAAGLRWLGAAGGAAVAQVLDQQRDRLLLRRIEAAPPTPDAAERLGRGLATMHAAGAPAYGSGPDGWQGDGWLGPLIELLPLSLGSYPSWGPMYAELRLLPLVREGVDRGCFDRGDTAAIESLADRVAAGSYDTGEPPARLHGDLWSGNVMWAPEGAVLIDPAAHGGHREADLAMLALFGCPQLERVLAAYDEVALLADGWRERMRLHQIHPLLLHAVLFGGGYVSQARAAVDAYL